MSKLLYTQKLMPSTFLDTLDTLDASGRSATDALRPTLVVPDREIRRPKNLSGGIAFDEPVPPNGYLWWYVDALSDDGQHALTLIAFVGSVFSPYYAHARRKAHSASAGAEPEEFCSINAALYRGVGGLGTRGPRAPHGYWWAMTEHSRLSMLRDSSSMQVGRSGFSSSERELLIELDELTVPFPQRVRGRIRIDLARQCEEVFVLSPDGRHLWRPIAPSARIHVELSHPAMQWEGHAYIDSNRGDAPLESAFRDWTWTRSHEVREDGSLDSATRVFYEVQTNRGECRQISAAFAPGVVAPPGTMSHRSVVSTAAPVPPSRAVERTGWGIQRSVPCDADAPCRVLKTVESAPFYARSLIETTLGGRLHRGMHESLSMRRFEKRWVQYLLPFKMPRRR